MSTCATNLMDPIEKDLAFLLMLMAQLHTFHDDKTSNKLLEHESRVSCSNHISEHGNFIVILLSWEAIVN